MISEVLVANMLAFIGIYIIVTLGLNIKAGHTGIPDFGHAMFFAVGGIVVGNIIAHIAAFLAQAAIPPGQYPEDLLNEWERSGVNNLVDGVLGANIKTVHFINQAYLANEPAVSIALLFIALILATVLGGLLGWLASLPALRLRGEYLAILLLTASEGLRILFTYTEQVMGNLPTVGLTVPALFAWTGNATLASAIFTITFAVIVFILMEMVHNSPAGRLFRAIRDDEDAARALGKDVALVRRDAMIVGSALAALAGVLYSVNPVLGGGSVAAQSIFNRVWWTFWPWALMILGGMASNRGIAVAVSIVGVLLIGPIRLYKQQLAETLGVDRIGLNPDYFANSLEYMLVGLMIILVLAFRPQGIIPEPPSRTVRPPRGS